MDIINPNAPVYNTIIFYIMIVCLLLIIKPTFMYCHKTQKFKQFGCGPNRTLLSFPLVTIGVGIILYMLFLGVDTITKYLDDK